MRAKITPRTKGIVPVHLYGAICDMDAVMDLARERGLYVVEDCAEALGSSRSGKPAGSFGDIGTFSFFGNKTVTTGEGGMVIARDAALATDLRLTRGQGMDPTRRYWHDRLGFNYRMTNIAAAIGCAQMERVQETLARKAEIARLYREGLQDTPVTFQKPSADTVTSDWLVSVLLPRGVDRDQVMNLMRAEDVDSRPVFYCSHQMPMYVGKGTNSAGHGRFPVAEDISARGLSLPSFPTMSNEMVRRVCDTLTRAISRAG